MKNAMQLKAIMKKLAKENQISAQLVLQNYMLERFLERVSLSPYRDNYIIKGGFLISSMVGLNSRATMDMDATIKGYPVTQDTVQKMIEKINALTGAQRGGVEHRLCDERVDHYDTHRCDTLKESAVLPTMWYRTRALLQQPGQWSALYPGSSVE